MHGLSTQQWRDDLLFLAAELRDRRPNLFHSLSDSAFDRAVRLIDRALPKMPPPRVAAAFSELVSLIGIRNLPHRHPAILAARTSRLLPLRLHRFPEGIFVTDAAARHRCHRGSLLQAIGGVAIGEVVAALHPLVARDDLTSPDPTLPLHLIATETLHGLGIVANPARTNVLLRTPRGTLVDVDMNAMAAPFYNQWAGRRLLGPPRRPGVAYLRKPAQAIWLEYVESHQALFLQVNKPVPRSAMQPYADVIADAGRRNAIGRVIIDLRLNRNDDPRRYVPLLQAVTENPLFRHRGTLFVLTRCPHMPPRRDLAAVLISGAGALLVCEPPTEFREQYREALPVVLPHSGIALHLSHLTWHAGQIDLPSPRRPDIPVSTTAADFFADRDPALEMALAHTEDRCATA